MRRATVRRFLLLLLTACGSGSSEAGGSVAGGEEAATSASATSSADAATSSSATVASSVTAASSATVASSVTAASSATVASSVTAASSSGASMTATTSTGGGCNPTGPLGNAVITSNGEVVPLAPITAVCAGTRALGFSRSGGDLSAVGEDGAAIWTANVGAGTLFSGFDFDADGWPDAGLVRSTPNGGSCGSSATTATWIDVVEGRTGVVHPLTSPLDDLCWSFPGNVYPTQQWTHDSVLFGAGTSTLAVLPYYATTGWYLSWSGASFTQSGALYFPSTPSYDAEYPAAQPNAWATGSDYVLNSHTANGLIGASGLLFFTSGRFARYALTDLSPAQLVFDAPFLSGGRTEMGGRNYGVVAVDPGAPDRIALVAGTSAASLFADMTSGAMTSDPWGGIERHVTIVDTSAATIDDRFVSYAHDNGDANQFDGRISFPANPFVRRGGASRLAFNVYAGGRWWLHVTAPGSTADAVTLEDLFLWDIRDLDADGIDEWVISPAHDPTDPDVPGFYFLKWRTIIAHWDEASATLALGAAKDGAIPFVAPAGRAPTATSSEGYLFPALAIGQPSGFALVGWTPSHTVTTLALP